MADRRHIEAVLQRILRRQGRSLMQYVRESSPYSPAGGGDGPARFQLLAEEELAGQVELTNYLVRKHLTPPYLGAFPQYYTTLNYVSFAYLLPKLLDEECKEVAALETDLAAVDDPETRERLQKMLGMKQRHLQALAAMKSAS